MEQEREKGFSHPCGNRWRDFEQQVQQREKSHFSVSIYSATWDTPVSFQTEWRPSLPVCETVEQIQFSLQEVAVTVYKDQVKTPVVWQGLTQTLRTKREQATYTEYTWPCHGIVWNRPMCSPSLGANVSSAALYGNAVVQVWFVFHVTSPEFALIGPCNSELNGFVCVLSKHGETGNMCLSSFYAWRKD